MGRPVQAGVPFEFVGRTRLALVAMAFTAAAACGGGDGGSAATNDAAKVEPTFSAVRTSSDHRELEIQFPSHGTMLAGTLFVPSSDGAHPAVVWVHASGEHERLGYGTLIKSAMTAGIGFFSYDKRGVGESDGKCCPADNEDAAMKEFGEQADDALAAIDAVRTRPEVDPSHVGLLGVSQAGWIVPIAATRSPHVAFTVIASGATVTTGEEAFYSDLTGDENVKESAKAELSRKLAKHGPSGFDPAPILAKVAVPGLWLYGSADGSVPPDESESVLDDLKASGKDFTYVVFPGAGHGLLDDNPPPPPDVIPTIYEWIAGKVA